MRNKSVQMSIEDIYDGVLEKVEEQKPEILALLDEHIDFENLVSIEFRYAFYSNVGRNHKHHLVSLIKLFVFQKLLGIQTDKLTLIILKLSRELREFCGFETVPDASLLSRFRERFLPYLEAIFEKLVEMTEPICQEIDKEKASYLIYDTTGLEVKVKENNPKFLNGKLKEAKKFQKNNPDYNPYVGVYKLLPDAAEANKDVHQQYINGHYCYAVKAGFVTNGLGIVRHISVFDSDFKANHPEIVSQKSDDPDTDKEIGDSTALKPVLSDFFSTHPSFRYSAFLGDAAMDSYQNYTMLRDDFGFDRVCIPLNLRNSKNSSADFDPDGTPVCPVDKTPFRFVGVCRGQKRSFRMKWVCHKSVKKRNTRVCTCEHPCTASKYGKCVYTYPNKNFRLYPGVPRNTELWDDLYRHRVQIERTIHIFKDSFALDARKSLSSVSLKADLLLAGISHLLVVLLAHALHEFRLVKSSRRFAV